MVHVSVKQPSATECRRRQTQSVVSVVMAVLVVSVVMAVLVVS
jgi:hypothetical protein